MNLQDILKFDPSQLRDSRGRWARGPQGFGMVSPNVEEGLSLDQAEGALRANRHAELRRGFDEIDGMMGMRASTNDGIGAWADGAEDSTITKYRNSDYEEVRAAMAMKGWISDQKAVVAFQQEENGPHVMFETRVPGTVAAVHKELIDSGVEFHTLVEDGDGVRVYAFSQDEALITPFTGFARKHGQATEVTFGRGDFIGSWDSREEGRSAYEAEIEGFLGRWDHSGEIRERWGRLRDHWGAASRAQGLRKAEKFPLYVSRRVINSDELIAWAKSQGFNTTVPPDQLHVTVAYSRDPVDWDAAGDHFDYLTLRGGERTVASLGDKGAIVLKFTSGELQARWQQFRDAGASWDYESYQPHVTLTYSNPDNLDPSTIEPFDGVLEFGPEIYEPLNLDWADTVVEKSVSDINVTLDHALKFNAYRDSLGRYAPKPGGDSMEEDMDKQMSWLDEKARQFGYDSLDQFMEANPEAFTGMAEIWRETHARKLEALIGVLKSNPFHDERGRFTTGPKATFVSIGDRFKRTIDGKRQRYFEAEFQRAVDQQRAERVQNDKYIQSVLDQGMQMQREMEAALAQQAAQEPLTPTITSSGQKTLGLPGQEAADVAADAARLAARRDADDRAVATEYVRNMRRVNADGVFLGRGEQDADILLSAWKSHVKDVSLREFVDTMMGPDADLPKITLTVERGGVKIRSLGGKVYGADVEHYARSFDFDSKDVHHDYLKLLPGGRGGNAVKELFRNAIPLYKKMGMQTVSVYANLDAGGYAWARFGFRANSAYTARDLRDSYMSAIERPMWGVDLSPEAKAEFQAVGRTLAKAGSSEHMPQLITSLKTPQLDKALAGYIRNRMEGVPPNVPRTLTRAVMQHVSWNGTLNLYNKTDMDTLQAYVGKFKSV